MLTLAFAQILYAVAFQWVEVTGGDNGDGRRLALALGRRPRAAYYYLTLVAERGLRSCCCDAAIDAPFGYTLRAARDSDSGADAIGIDVRRHRWLAFTLAGAAAGLAGGLFAFSKGRSIRALTRHLDLRRCADDAAAGRRPDAGGAAGRAPAFSIAARPDHAADRALAPGPRAQHHRHRAGCSRAASSAACSGGGGGPRRGMTLLACRSELGKSFGGVVAASASRSPSTPPSCSPSSGRTAPASRRSSTWSAASCGPTAVASRSTGHVITGLRRAPHLAPRCRPHLPGRADLRVHDGAPRTCRWR